MRIHHLNCATLCPYSRRLINGDDGYSQPGLLVCHCLLLEMSRGLVLVDTGFGTRDLEEPGRRMGPLWVATMRPRLDPSETALHQVRALGFEREDVHDVVLTHMDFDHAGGLPDFPHATVHVFAPEFAAATRIGVWKLRRYTPAQWSHRPNWVLHRTDGDRWMGFEAVRALRDSEPEVLLIPLIGHSAGHCGVAVRRDTGHEGNGAGPAWLLHCGDAYFHHDEIAWPHPDAPLGIRAYEQIYQYDPRMRLFNQARLRELDRQLGGEVAVFCAHDPVYLDRLRELDRVTPARAAVMAGAGAAG